MYVVSKDLDEPEEEELGDFQPKAWGRTFNPADYNDSSATDGFGAKQESWELGENDAADGTGTWKNSVEEWTAEDWNEDLSETKVFTASSVPAENHVASGQSIDLVTLLQNPGGPNQDLEATSFDASQQQDNFSQALIFTNSQHNPQMALGTSNPSTVNTYSAQSLSSVLSSGIRELSSSKLANSTGSQILEPLKSPGLGQFASQGPLNTTSPVSTTPTSSWDVKSSTSQPSILSHLDFKSQPEPSPVLSQLTQRQQQPPPPPAASAPPPGLEYFAPQKGREPLPVDSCAAGSKTLPLSNVSPESQGVPAHPTQQKPNKPPKRRTPPVSKIPSSAVEMPGSTDVSGLNVQFGALEFGLEPAVSEFGSASSYESSPAPNNILYTQPVNEPLNTSLPMSNTVQESAYSTPVITSSLTCSVQSTSLVTASSSSSYDPASPHNRMTYQSSVPPMDTTVFECSQLLTLLRPFPRQNWKPLLHHYLPKVLRCRAPRHPPLCFCLQHLLTRQHFHQHNSVENATALQPSNSFSVAATMSTTSSATSMASTTNSLGLNATSVSLPIPTSRAAPLVSSGKAPPNLPQGVPPLLHNQYFVGPGGLLPAYPVSHFLVPASLARYL
ncbi:hypothetical protein Chor_013650 [Crotalus horridus]